LHIVGDSKNREGQNDRAGQFWRLEMNKQMFSPDLVHADSGDIRDFVKFSNLLLEL